MMFSILQHRAKTLITENASTILTAGGVIGTVTTATLAGRAAFKAADIIREEEVKAVQEGNGHTMGLSNWERTRLVWPLFIPPVIIGGATIGSIVMANQMSAQRAAALAAAYGISQKQLDEYKRKLEEKLGVKKAEAIRDEIQQDRINRHPPDSVIIVGTGPVLCYDAFSDRYFKSTAEHLRKAERVVNGEIDTGNECKLGVFYNELELPNTMFDDMLGWNVNNPCRIAISAMMMNDDACLCVEFVNLPFPNYGVDY
jgi:hypothetical protein